MIFLSLFEGMGCGRITLKKMGIEPTKYYASEIDKFAIAENKANFPDTIHLGDVSNWREWPIDWSKIDWLIGGSPCQGFSRAGSGYAFDDPRSKLFFIYIDILNHIKKTNPKVKFLLENVTMRQEWVDVITQYINCKPVLINSELVSAQSRPRLYWANFEITQPKDRGIKLKSILETDVDEKYYHTLKAVEYMNRKVKGGRTHWDFAHHSDSANDKSARVVANFPKGVPYNILIDREKAYAITSSYCNGCDPQQYFEQNRKQLIFRRNNKDYTFQYRKLTVVECCRLQGVNDDYFKVSSNTQAYKMLGNGWQCDTIEHIYKCGGIDAA